MWLGDGSTVWKVRAPTTLFGQAILTGFVATAAVLTMISCQPEHVPADIQRQLPLRTFFDALCPGSRIAPTERRQIMREAEVLLRELRRRPDELVTIEDADSYEPFDITVRELAEDRLDGLRMVREETGRDCAARLRQRLTAALR